MNAVSKILLGFIIIAVLACLWYLLTQKSGGKRGGCCGCCADCASTCEKRQDDETHK